MATYTKDQLKTQVDNTFPTNGQGLIQAASHRTFLKNLIDSLGGGGNSIISSGITIVGEADKGDPAPVTFSAAKIIDCGIFYILAISQLNKDMEYCFISSPNFDFSGITWRVNIGATEISGFVSTGDGSATLGSFANGYNDYAILFGKN
jgi:hypothetical protein